MKILRRISSMKWYWKLFYSFLTILIVIAIILRLYLSAWLLRYVNDVLASHVPGYQGSVASINIDLYRSAYRINHLILNKKEGNIPTPFLAIDETDFSIQWRGLFHGRVVANAKLTKPVINFAFKDGAKQTGSNVDWSKPIRDLMPIDIDYIDFSDGTVTYKDFSTTPQVNIDIHHMDGAIRNLRNVNKASDPLPSTIVVQGDSIGNGRLKINGRMNILKETPDMNILLALEGVHLPAINSYPEAYAAFTFKRGDLNFYMQFASKNGRVSGYVKPVVTNLSVDIVKSTNPLEIAWSAVVAGVLQLFTNISKDQFATRVDFTGTLANVDTDLWGAIGSIISNAFIEAMKKGFDETGHEVPSDNSARAKPEP